MGYEEHLRGEWSTMSVKRVEGNTVKLKVNDSKKMFVVFANGDRKATFDFSGTSDYRDNRNRKKKVATAYFDGMCAGFADAES